MSRTPEKAVYINGRFLTQNKTGVQRYSRELTKAIDNLLSKKNCSESLYTSKWYLVAPPGTECDLDLASISFTTAGRGGGHAWEQSYLANEASGGILLSPANSGPLLHRRQLVVIHDAAVYNAAGGYKLSYRFLHRNLGRLLARSAKIATVSEFSRVELASALRIPPGEIVVATNGADHLTATLPDVSVFARWPVEPNKYFVTIGLSNANKNIGLAIEAFKRISRPGIFLVVVGAGSARVVADQQFEPHPGIIFAGRLSDLELVALLRQAAAFVFPSLYEGFGLPLLEAMAQGCPVLASTAGAVIEVCAGAALHFAPDDASALTVLMQQLIDDSTVGDLLRKKGLLRPGAYLWTNAATQITNGLESLLSR